MQQATFIEYAQTFECRDGHAYITTGDDVRVMPIHVFRKNLASGNRALAKWDAEHISRKPVPIRARG